MGNNAGQAGTPLGTGVTETLQTMRITDGEYDVIRAFVYDHFGINLTEHKKSLVVGRLQQVLRIRGFRRFTDYFDFVKADTSGKALNELINQITTNHTFFYREKAHFEYFTGHVLPEVTARLKREGSRDLRVWCAGCSTGEEPYTLVMLMLEFFGMEYPDWDAGLLATDISGKALVAALEALYPTERLAPMPEHLRRKYFRQTPDGRWTVVDRVRKEVLFRRFNLMNKVFSFKEPFHVVFCRNVMIYFDKPTRDALVRRFHGVTKPGGYLFIGHSESLGRENCPFGYVMPAVYKKVEGK